MDWTKQHGGALIVTADHGNADEMYERDKKSGEFMRSEDGSLRAKTSHTLNPVPLYLYAPAHPELGLRLDLESPGLGNVAATTLNLCGLQAPVDYMPSLLSAPKG